jgi:hypothetical protein
MEVFPLRKVELATGSISVRAWRPDSDGSGAGTQERLAIELEHFCSPLRLASVTLKPSKLIS